ncbi:MAG: hypothetical protein HC848_01160 [Limnobacter sp.]|nr:hypothetical protein [Limnobacter sp.]
MAHMHEIRTQKKWLKALGALYQLFVELVIRAGSTFNTLWVVICLLLAGVAIYNFSHLNSLKEETSKRRLLEASAQDLLMQSITLRHVSSNLQDNENNAERLRRFGYASQAEVFTQLDSRLQLVTTCRRTVNSTTGPSGSVPP